MKNKIIALLCLLMLNAFLSSAQKLSKEQAKSDLKFCYETLKNNHPSVNRYTKENEFENIYKFLDARIVDSISVSDFTEIASVLAATTRCVHTNITTGFEINSASLFNLNFIIHQNKLYARGFANSSDTILYRIISINKVPSTEIIDRMLMTRSGDGYGQNFAEAYFSKNFNAFYNIFYNSPETANFIILNGKNEKEINVERTKKVNVKYKMYDWDGATVLDTMSAVKLYKLKNIPDTRVLRITSFKKKNINFYKKIFAEMQRDSVKQLVIDLRNNPGGNIYHAFHLLNNIIDKDLYMYAERRKSKVFPYLSTKGKAQYILGLFLYDVLPNGQRWNDTNGKKYYRNSYKTLNVSKYKPQVLVITDGNSVSASSLVASYLKYYYNAQIIGSESGGTFTGNNGRMYPEVILPISKIKLRLPLQYINYFPGVPNVGRGVKVDHFMSPLLDKKSQEQYIQSILLKNEN
jgi:hypothetical protein